MSLEVLNTKGRAKNYAIVAEVKPRLLMQHSHPDTEVSKTE